MKGKNKMRSKTESRNPKSINIDRMDTRSMVALINEENMNAVKAVEKTLDNVAHAIDEISERFMRGGRIFYIGAGTSGRLGVIDAAECPPTFGISKDRVVGIIAGGERCMSVAGEGNEDSETAGVEDIKKYNLNENDTVVGISVAGNAAYVVKALEYAKGKGCFTVGITSNEGSLTDKVSDVSIVPDTGAEVITGSTRLKAGSAQKVILNMISTSVMIKCGYVYENLMINLRPTNIKLTKRMIFIVSDILDVSEDEAKKLLDENDWSIRKVVDSRK